MLLDYTHIAMQVACKIPREKVANVHEYVIIFVISVHISFPPCAMFRKALSFFCLCMHIYLHHNDDKHGAKRVNRTAKQEIVLKKQDNTLTFFFFWTKCC